jgi:hypothetical protein
MHMLTYNFFFPEFSDVDLDKSSSSESLFNFKMYNKGKGQRKGNNPWKRVSTKDT